MLITEDGLLPTDDEGDVMAGDVRAAENVLLTSMHSLFVREHNRLADEIAAGNPDMTDEEIYQLARTIVIAEMQAITYNEFLPALLGDGAVSRYQGYDPSVDPGIANEFSTAAFRFGHSTLTDQFRFVGNDGQDVQDAVSLADAFFNPSMLETTGIDSLLKYGASDVAQQVDLQVVDSLRNFLFGPPGAGGLDLVSLNIQRGRDHGLADFNATRVAYGLEAYDSFAELTSDEELQANLETLYGDVNNIDLWVGLLAEDRASDSALGELATTIIVDQFERLRDGDRFWYENVLDRGQVRMINRTSLADIIERNTNVTSLQDNVFFFQPQVSGTITRATSVAETAAASPNDRRSNDRSRDNRGDEDEPVQNVVVELMDDEGNVVDRAATNRNGEFTFDSFTQTGNYQIRVAAENGMEVVGSDTLDVLVSSGDSRLGGYNFEVVA